jgi:hypothetical protein
VTQPLPSQVQPSPSTPLWSNASFSEYLVAIHVHGACFPWQATYANPNDIEADLIACTARRSRKAELSDGSILLTEG